MSRWLGVFEASKIFTCCTSVDSRFAIAATGCDAVGAYVGADAGASGAGLDLGASRAGLDLGAELGVGVGGSGSGGVDLRGCGSAEEERFTSRFDSSFGSRTTSPEVFRITRDGGVDSGRVRGGVLVEGDF